MDRRAFLGSYAAFYRQRVLEEAGDGTQKAQNAQNGSSRFVHFVLFVFRPQLVLGLVQSVHQVAYNHGNQHDGYNNNAYSDP